jgi:hypothetical protein
VPAGWTSGNRGLVRADEGSREGKIESGYDGEEDRAEEYEEAVHGFAQAANSPEGAQGIGGAEGGFSRGGQNTCGKRA